MLSEDKSITPKREFQNLNNERQNNQVLNCILQNQNQLYPNTYRRDSKKLPGEIHANLKKES